MTEFQANSKKSCSKPLKIVTNCGFRRGQKTVKNDHFWPFLTIFYPPFFLNFFRGVKFWPSNGRNLSKKTLFSFPKKKKCIEFQGLSRGLSSHTQLDMLSSIYEKLVFHFFSKLRATRAPWRAKMYNKFKEMDENWSNQLNIAGRASYGCYLSYNLWVSVDFNVVITKIKKNVKNQHLTFWPTWQVQAKGGRPRSQKKKFSYKV